MEFYSEDKKRIFTEKKKKKIPKISKRFLSNYLNFATALRYGTALSNS